MSKGLDYIYPEPLVSTPLDSLVLPPIIDSDDLIDARGIADLLGLGHPNSVSTYQRRYPDMPRPVVDLGRGRPKLWSRVAVVRWATESGRNRRT